MYESTVEELKRAYFDLLTEATTTTCCYWLLDARRRYNTNPVLQQWLIQEFMPRANSALTERIHMAYLLAPQHLRDADADTAFPPAAFFEGRAYLAERFTEEGKAIEWLQQQQPARAL